MPEITGASFVAEISILRSKDGLSNSPSLTLNEAVLIKLMELRETPIKYDKSFRNIDEDYERWKNGL